MNPRQRPLANEDIITISNLCKSFGKKSIYKDLNLSIRRGETITVIGGSGTGKSVLLKCIIGLMSPDSGSIVFDGIELTNLREPELVPIRKRIAMLFQGAALFDSLDVGENIAYPIREHFRKMPSKELMELIAHKLELVGLPGIERMSVADLSGGMRKRVALARALAIEPEVVLYDEPTTGLDPINMRRINDLIIKLNESLGVTSIVVTHDMESAYRVSHRMAMLYNHRILAVGSVDEIRDSKIPEVRNFVHGMSLEA